LVMRGDGGGRRSSLYILTKMTFTGRRWWIRHLVHALDRLISSAKEIKGRWRNKHNTSLGSWTRNGASEWLWLVYPEVALVYSKVWLYEERYTAGSKE